MSIAVLGNEEETALLQNTIAQLEVTVATLSRENENLRNEVARLEAECRDSRLSGIFASIPDWDDPSMDVYNDYDAALAALRAKEATQ